MSKLRECPFCGGEATLKEISGRWTVHCREHCAGTRIFNDKERPVAAWNRRAEPENKPLTQEEVSVMCGEPLYVIPLDADADWESHWSIMQWDSVTANSILSKGKMYFLYEADYGKTWLAYRNRLK